MKYKVYKALEMPKAAKNVRTSAPLPSMWPWSKMEVGDSFFVGEYAVKAMLNILTLANHSWQADNEGWRWSTRKIENELWIWRTK
jgi:hypothetical protein